MNDTSNGYNISFFKPTTPQAKSNRNLTLWLVSIWAIAIFGFQLFLRLVEKPTPEPEYTVFNEVWEDVKSGTADNVQLQNFGKSALTVLCKIAIDSADKVALNNALNWSIYELTQDTLKPMVLDKINEFESIKDGTDDISDSDYLTAKQDLSIGIAPILNLSVNDIRSKILPLELMSENMTELLGETVTNLPLVMKKYLVHNQSFLTDFIFLGFPFHYFYTAVFLLILFVGLCLLYCVKTDKLNAKNNITD